MKWPKRQEIWLSEGTALVNRVWASMTLSNTSCLQYSEVKKTFLQLITVFLKMSKKAKLLQNNVCMYILQTSLHFVSFLIWQNIFSQCNHETAIFDGTDQVYVLWLWHFVCYFMLILSVTVEIRWPWCAWNQRHWDWSSTSERSARNHRQSFQLDRTSDHLDFNWTENQDLKH